MSECQAIGPIGAPAEQRTREPVPFLPLLLGCLGLGLLGALWVLADDRLCAGCADTPLPMLRLWLAGIGAGFYGLALAVAISWGPILPLRLGVFAAGGVHLALLGVLLSTRNLCVPCLLSGIGALAAAGILWLRDGRNLGLAAAAFLVAAGSTSWFTVRAGAASRKAGQDEAARLTRRVLAEVAPPRGTARLVWFTRPACRSCGRLRRELLPRLQREFGRHLLVEERRATRLLTTPTVLVQGWHRYLFLGAPSEEDLRRAILRAQGKNSARPARAVAVPRPMPQGSVPPRNPLTTPPGELLLPSTPPLPKRR